jgi:HK97 gp10 family phage protein
MVGFDEIDRALGLLPQAVQERVVRTAMVKALMPVRDFAASLAPQQTGRLAESIQIGARLTRRQRRGRATPPRTIEQFVGASYRIGGGGRHAHLVEFGTVTMAARPFLRPAWDAMKGGIIDSLRRDLWTAIARAARRLARASRAVVGPVSRN